MFPCVAHYLTKQAFSGTFSSIIYCPGLPVPGFPECVDGKKTTSYMQRISRISRSMSYGCHVLNKVDGHTNRNGNHNNYCWRRARTVVKSTAGMDKYIINIRWTVARKVKWHIGNEVIVQEERIYPLHKQVFK